MDMLQMMMAAASAEREETQHGMEFGKEGVRDVATWMEELEAFKLLPASSVRLLCARAADELMEENTVVSTEAPVAVCGDIHGQFPDLLKIFQLAGDVGSRRYVFLGDFVDRGKYSVETICYLLCLKVRYGDRIVLLRGNHEGRGITRGYGFYDEVARKYGSPNVWTYITDVFDFLPLAAVIADKLFCVHGGLSPEAATLDQLRVLPRGIEPPETGAMADIMWSDPDETVERWQRNPRGAGWLFGPAAAHEFNHVNGLTTILRAHQLAMEGFYFAFRDESLITVWSAPNYCFRNNLASVLIYDEELNRKFHIFKQDSQAREEGHDEDEEIDLDSGVDDSTGGGDFKGFADVLAAEHGDED